MSLVILLLFVLATKLSDVERYLSASWATGYCVYECICAPTSTVLSFSAWESGQVGSKLRSAISFLVVAVQQWLQLVHP